MSGGYHLREQKRSEGCHGFVASHCFALALFFDGADLDVGSFVGVQHC
jgi:hypothetical protein